MPRPTFARLFAGVLAVVLASSGVVITATAPAEAATTWVVDIVDDDAGNRFEAVATGTSEVTIQVGDTVEWQFDEANQGHDLTSQDIRTAWPTPISVFGGQGSPAFQYTFNQPGNYEYFCSLHGQMMRGTVNVEAVTPNQAPTAAAVVTPQSGPAPLQVHFTANGSDPDGDPVSYLWDFGTSNPDERSIDNHVMFDYTTPGTYTAKLEVTDSNGAVYEQSYPITVTAPVASPVTATPTPSAGPAPLNVAFNATVAPGYATNPTYSWSFGDGSVGVGPIPSHVYTTPGPYTAVVTVQEGGALVGSALVPITVAGGPLPSVAAVAAPSSGTGPLNVAFSTEVTASGEFHPFANGLTTYPNLTGSATLVRKRGATTATLDVTGVAASAAHPVHVHEKPCATSDGGAHFRFDESKPFAAENEIWPAFTSTGSGASGPVSVTQPLRAGPHAVSMVIHNPANPALRIGCADLAPSIDDLTYAWNFGDGSTGTGADPDHTYAVPGTYTATVSVSHEHDHIQAPATASVQVTVASSTPTPTPTPTPTVTATPLPLPPPTPDTSAPDTVITAVPASAVRSRSAKFDMTSEPGVRFECKLDGASWTACAPGVTFSGLSDGHHTFEVRALDAAGNADASPATRAWTIDATAPVIKRTTPKRATRDRTPTVKATIKDAYSAVTRKSVKLKVDGRSAKGARFKAAKGSLVWASPRALAPGRHKVKLVVSDALGNRRVKSWTFTVR